MATKKKLLQAAAGAAGGAGLNVEDVFSTYLYDGTGSAQTITNGIDLSGEGGLVWAKLRTTEDEHVLFDTERGATKQLDTTATTAEETQNGGVTAFNSDGFTVGTNANINASGGSRYVTWTFRKAPKFFDVVTATAPSSGTLQVSHDLGTTVGCIILKSTSNSDNWVVYHRSQGADGYGLLNSTGAWSSVTGAFDGVTDTYFTLDTSVNCTAGRTYVAYLFAHNDGDGEFGPDGDQDIIKCGSYTGTGSEMFVDLGFEPQFFLTKRTDSVTDWFIVDVMRGMAADQADPYLRPNQSGAEANTGGNGWHPSPTGITIQSSSQITSGANYIYIAIRRGPMAVPTDATEVFDVNFQDATAPSFDTGFNVDFGLRLYRPGGTPYAASRLTGTERIGTNSSGSAVSSASYVWDYQDGWGDMGITTSDVVAMSWQRAPNYFDVVAYTGNGTAGRTVSHNLGVAPEMMWVKNRDDNSNWSVNGSVGGLVYGTNKLLLQQNGAIQTDANEVTAVSATNFTLGDSNATNGSSDNIIAYLFASLDGVSKVGSINHTSGVDTNVDCGFSNGARFVLWKQTDAANSWGVVDVERGLVTGNDPLLLLNTTDAETSSYDLIDPLSSGFVFTGTFGTGSYIFYAIA